MVSKGTVPPLVIFLVGILVTSIVTFLLHRTVESRNRELFQSSVVRTLAEINSRAEAYIALLRGTAGFVNAVDSMSRSKFADYVNALRLEQHYPGIQGIGLTLRVPEGERLKFEAMAREDFPSFRIWPDHARDEFHAIRFLEPLDARNFQAIGYDMFTEENRRTAMRLARDTGGSVASGLVTLVQEIDADVQPGFLIYLPVYEGIMVPDTLEERREHLVGFVYSPFRTRDLFEGIFREGLPRVSFSIYDGETPDPEHLLFRAGPAGPHEPKMRSALQIDIARRAWTVAFASTPALEAAMSPAIAPGAFVLGLVISGLIAAFFALQHRSAVEREYLLGAERAAREEAERSGRMKDEFLATLSHELRTPLTSILGWANLLQQQVLSAEEVDEAHTIIRQNSESLAQLIDELLDMNRVMSGKLNLAVERVNLREVIESAVTSIRPLAKSKDLGLRLDWRDEALRVKGDTKRLRQIFWNLLTNAVKFTPPHGSVEISWRRSDDFIEVVVADTGQGIDPTFLPYLFDRFRQADASVTRDHRGLGLGLAIVKSLVELHGGEIRAESAGHGKGTQMTVRLPLLSERAPPSRADDAPEGSQRNQLQGRRILVVEDEKDARDFIVRVLQGQGAIVRGADSAPKGLRILCEEKFDLVISDIGMPEMDGFAFLRSVRGGEGGDNQDVPAIAVTAFARAEDQEKAIRAGFQKHLSKPIFPDLLVDACRDLINAG